MGPAAVTMSCVKPSQIVLFQLELRTLTIILFIAKMANGYDANHCHIELAMSLVGCSIVVKILLVLTLGYWKHSAISFFYDRFANHYYI